MHQPKSTSRREHPDEEGTETIGAVDVEVADGAAAESTPMKRGPKPAQGWRSRRVSRAAAESTPMKRGLKPRR